MFVAKCLCCKCEFTEDVLNVCAFIKNRRKKLKLKLCSHLADLLMDSDQQTSDGQDGVEGQSLGEQHSDSVHHQQVEVELCFFCTEVRQTC